MHNLKLYTCYWIGNSQLLSKLFNVRFLILPAVVLKPVHDCLDATLIDKRYELAFSQVVDIVRSLSSALFSCSSNSGESLRQRYMVFRDSPNFSQASDMFGIFSSCSRNDCSVFFCLFIISYYYCLDTRKCLKSLDSKVTEYRLDFHRIYSSL